MLTSIDPGDSTGQTFDDASVVSWGPVYSLLCEARLTEDVSSRAPTGHLELKGSLTQGGARRASLPLG